MFLLIFSILLIPALGVESLRSKVSGCVPQCQNADESAFKMFCNCISEDFRIRSQNGAQLTSEVCYDLYLSACQAKQDTEFQDHVLRHFYSWPLLIKDSFMSVFKYLMQSTAQLACVILVVTIFVIFSSKSSSHSIIYSRSKPEKTRLPLPRRTSYQFSTTTSEDEKFEQREFFTDIQPRQTRGSVRKGEPPQKDGRKNVGKSSKSIKKDSSFQSKNAIKKG